MKKNLFYLFSLVMMMAMSMTFVSCNDDDDKDGDDEDYVTIVGDWSISNGSNYMVYSFKQNYTGAIYGEVNGSSFNYPITWGYESKTKSLTITFQDGSYTVFTVRSLTSSSLVLYDAEDGDTINLKRNGTISPTPETSSNSLVGVWYAQEGSEAIIFGFYDNSKGEVAVNQGDDWQEMEFTYTYNKSSGSLTITLTNGNKLQYTVVSVTQNQLVLRDSDGNRLTLTRYEGSEGSNSRTTRAAGFHVSDKQMSNLMFHMLKK